MGPLDPRRAFQDEIRQLLGDQVLRGERLLQAIASLGPRHSIDPFRAVLNCTLPLDRPEAEAREVVVSIERHRGEIESLLMRDPGFTVAAFDLLHEMDRTIREPVFREDGLAGADTAPGANPRAPDHMEHVLRLESRRAERSGRPLTVIVLSADEPDALTAGARSAVLAMLRDGTRDVDSLLESPSGDFVLLLPCTGGREGLRAADRFRRGLLGATGAAFCAGVASAPGRAAEAHVLVRLARQALVDARRTGSGAALHRTERRAHSRIAVGDALPARLRNEGMETEILVEDLSLGGALLITQHRIDPGGEVVLAVRGPSARPAGYLIPSRVLRVQDGVTPGQAPFRAAVGFQSGTRLRVAALLAALRVPDSGEAS